MFLQTGKQPGLLLQWWLKGGLPAWFAVFRGSNFENKAGDKEDLKQTNPWLPEQSDLETWGGVLQ